jgi:hypothetical protein
MHVSDIVRYAKMQLFFCQQGEVLRVRFGVSKLISSSYRARYFEIVLEIVHCLLKKTPMFSRCAYTRKWCISVVTVLMQCKDLYML